jgi:hypothetical protein
MSFHVPEKYRLYGGRMGSDASDGNNGMFPIPRSAAGKRPLDLCVIASDGLGWEHVSVSTLVRCPTWEEMCFVKALFWDDDDCVVQFHPPKSEYVNHHPYCLHLWRPTDHVMLMPDWILVGPKASVTA